MASLRKLNLIATHGIAAVRRATAQEQRSRVSGRNIAPCPPRSRYMPPCGVARFTKRWTASRDPYATPAPKPTRPNLTMHFLHAGMNL